MSESNEKNSELEKQKVSDHLSNERTLLAWVRTSVGVMAFGFVVVEFSLLTKDFNLAMEVEIEGKNYGYSGPIGIVIVAIGAVCSLFALIRYHRTKKEINTGTFRNSDFMLNLIVGLIFTISVLLLIYIIKAL